MKKAAAFLLACLAAAQLCACAADPSQPVVTSDVLVSQDSAVQTALEQSAGQDYAYYWECEHIDEEIEDYAELYRQEIERLRSSESVSAAQLIAFYETELENGLQTRRDYLEGIAALNPPVSAQEAANIAGEIFETLYGIDLSRQSIVLSYVQSVDCWEAISSPLLDERGNILTDISTETASNALCSIRSDTGEIESMSYHPSQQEVQAMAATELPAYIESNAEYYNAAYGMQTTDNYFDTDAPGAQEALEAMKEQLTALLSGTVAVGGAQITSVTAENVVYSPQLPRESSLYFHLTANNGRTYTLFWGFKYPNYDFGGFPLRAFSLSSGS